MNWATLTGPRMPVKFEIFLEISAWWKNLNLIACNTPLVTQKFFSNVFLSKISILSMFLICSKWYYKFWVAPRMQVYVF